MSQTITHAQGVVTTMTSTTLPDAANGLLRGRDWSAAAADFPMPFPGRYPMPDPCPTPRKHSYPSKAKAAHYQRYRYAPSGQTKDRLYPYLCSCGAWHLSHLHPSKDGAP